MKQVIISIISTLLLANLVSCSVYTNSITREIPTTKPIVINLALTESPQSNRFVNLDYGIKLNVKDERASHKQGILYKHDDYLTMKPTVNVYPDVRSFVSESMRRYMRTLGFNLDADVATDYLLDVRISEYNVSYLAGIGWSATVNMTISVYDSNNQLVYPNVEVVGRNVVSASGNDYTYATRAINAAYVTALEDIDWDRIAFFLKRADSPAQEKNKQVTGDGSTSLEHTILNWQVTSRPAGADIYWRVISSTPDVKNSNKNYKTTTPYESTESFDIKGLTYNNSSDVQIEITCEKPGYLPQTKAFNVRAAIDQKSINAHFTLIKDE